MSQDIEASEAYAQLLSAIQQRLGFNSGPRSGNDYLSIAATSEFVPANDAAKVNRMADMIPGEKPLITSFNSYPTLADVYQFIISSLTGPSWNPPKEYTDAQAKLYDPQTHKPTKDKAEYDKIRGEILEIESRIATTAAEKTKQATDLQEANERWDATVKPTIDGALATISAFNFLSGWRSTPGPAGWPT